MKYLILSLLCAAKTEGKKQNCPPNAITIVLKTHIKGSLDEVSY